MLIFVPLIGVLLSMFIRPFSLRRIFLHTIFPIVPLIVMIDGIISALRTYSFAEVQELLAQIKTEHPELKSEEYVWEMKRERCGLFYLADLTYYVGYPRTKAA